jgi:hypothetical protein
VSGEKARVRLPVEISVCTQTKQITGTQNFLKFDHLHVREKLVHVELQELKCDVTELNAILFIAVRQKAKRGYLNRNQHYFI